MFHGSITALITPFRDGAVDWAALDTLIDFQIDQGSHGLVVCGTTAETPTLSAEEHHNIVVRTINRVKGRIPVIVGSGTNSTESTIALTRAAEHAGADAALIVTPYYNKPTQDGLFAHYRAVHDATKIPILLYNIPGRSVMDMHNDTIARLAELPRIIGIKDATADLSRPILLRSRLGPAFCQLSGEDATAMPFLAAGGHGCISVLSNIAPSLCARLQSCWRNGNVAEAEMIRDRLAPLARALFVETSPAPVKYAASRLGLCGEEVRLPLVPASATARSAVDAALDYAGLLDNKGTETAALAV
jgi:4-hydroxy-tetrahydrodipicolinate synthase